MALDWPVATFFLNGWQGERMSVLQMVQTGISSRFWSPTRTLILLFLAIIVALGVLSAYEPRLSLLLAVGVPGGLSLLVWPEVTLVLYTNAGLFKADPRLSALSGPVDITLALAAVLVATLAYRLVLRRERMVWSREISLVFLFAGVILMGLIYTPAGSYATEKAFRFLSLTMLAFFVPILVIKSYRSLWLFLIGWLGFAALLSVEALGQLGNGQRLSAFNATTISISRAVGVAILILLFAVVIGRVSRRWQLTAAAGMALMMLVLVGTGSRGPLLVLGVTTLFTMGIAFLKPGRRARSLLIVAILAITVAGVFVSGLVPATSLERFSGLIDQEQGIDTSSQARLMVMQVAWHLFTTSPFIGRGTGSVSAFDVGRELTYPHNILLELAAETGIVGLGLYLAIVSMVLWQLLANWSQQTAASPLYLALLATIIFTLLNAMVSGDLNDNRDLWLFAGTAVAAIHIGKEEAV